MMAVASALASRGRALVLTTAFVIFGPLASPDGLSGQSLLAREGLGIPAPALDARTRALGSNGVGMSGWYIGSADPSAAAGIVLPTIVGTLQPVQATLGNGQEAGGTRFPLLGIAYPYRENVFFVRLESFLDQEWEDRSEQSLMLEGSEVLVRDQFVSSGGIGRVQVGWARRIGGDLALGASVGSYVGSVERRFSRSLSGEDVVPGVEPFRIQGRWRASGTTADVGATWDPSSLLRVSGAIGWSGNLELAPVAGQASEAGEYSMPLELRGGGTFTLTPGLELAMGVTYADWSDIGADLTHGGTRGDTWSYGAGIEWSQSAFRDRPLPLRLGVREAQLPFLADGESVSERTYSAGIGWYLAETETVPLARFELGLERGERGGGANAESFWRTTISVRLAGG